MCNSSIRLVAMQDPWRLGGRQGRPKNEGNIFGRPMVVAVVREQFV